MADKKQYFFSLEGKPLFLRPQNTYFIVFDSLDGSGQTTQANLLKKFLSQQGLKIHITKEPTSNLIGGLIRGQLSGEWHSNQECLQLLFSADRAHHLEKEIIPLLKKGITVICDRYFFSTIAYGGIDIQDKRWLIEINKKFLLPDIFFFLKVKPQVCIQRIQENRFEVMLFEKKKLLTKVFNNYLQLTKEFSDIAMIVDGEKPPQEVFAQIKKIFIKKFFNETIS